MTTIVITGASRGMGAHTARQLAATGATVFAGARRPEELTARLRESGASGDIRPIALDVTDDASVAEAAAHLERVVGAVDVLVNNAGVPGTWAPAADVGPGASPTSSRPTCSAPSGSPRRSCRCCDTGRARGW